MPRALVIAVSLAALVAAGCVPAPEPARPAPAPRVPTPAPAPSPSRPPAPAPGEAIDPAIGLSVLEADVIRETNRARRDPRGYAALLEAQLRHFDGTLLRLPGQVPVRTTEGAAAMREAIRVLRSTKPLSPLAASRGLSAGARDHVRDQGRRGATGHAGRDGSSAADRVNRHGRWDVSVSENISYGPATARDVVVQLLVDDGVPGRGHRQTILDPVARMTGVSCGPHKEYGTMCVIVYAGAYSEGG